MADKWDQRYKKNYLKKKLKGMGGGETNCASTMKL